MLLRQSRKDYKIPNRTRSPGTFKKFWYNRDLSIQVWGRTGWGYYTMPLNNRIQYESWFLRSNLPSSTVPGPETGASYQVNLPSSKYWCLWLDISTSFSNFLVIFFQIDLKKFQFPITRFSTQDSARDSRNNWKKNPKSDSRIIQAS